MGALAESFGLSQGMKYRGRIKDELETRARDGSRRGSRDRPTARSAGGITRCPASSAAATTKAEEHLRKALDVQPAEHGVALLPAEVLLERRQARTKRARLLQQVLDAPLDPDWAPEDRDFKRKAHETLRSSVRSARIGGHSRLRLHGTCKTPRPTFLPSLPASTMRLSSGGAANIASLYSSNMMFAM